MSNKMPTFTLAQHAPLTCCVAVRAPQAIFDLLTVSLSGWDVRPEPEDTQVEPVIDVRDTGKLQVHSRSYTGARPHSDLINTLNDVFIALAFCVRDSKRHFHLMHAAALKSGGEISLLFGSSKSGKSRYIAERCVKGDVCIADDLILRSETSGLCETLGIPLRLRRPVSLEIVQKIDSSTLLVGHSICYFTPATCALMPAGRVFSPDHLFQFDEGYKLRTMDLSELDRLQLEHRIH